MNPVNNPEVPAGITDSDVEIFAVDGGLKFTQNGMVHSIDLLPRPILRGLLREMYQNRPAIRALRTIHKSISEMFYHYVICNYGGFDFEPDSAENGRIRNREIWDCGCRGTCKFYGKICNNIISPREYQVLGEISTGHPDKWISDRLGIAYNTLAVHKRNIARKLNLHSKAEMTRFILSR